MLKKGDNNFLTSFFQNATILFSRVIFAWHVILSDTRSFFYNNRISQDNFIKQSNKILAELGMESLDVDGECSSLSNLYIKYAIEQRKHDFFESISDVCFGQLNDTLSIQKKLYFFDDLSSFSHSYSSYLENRSCRDAFSFISRDLVELEVNITAIINKMQAHQRNLYVHITLGHAHSFVLEQSFVNDQFVYYVYDPNSLILPQAIFTSEAVANEINLVVQRAKLGALRFKYLFNEDHNVLLSFYLYTDDTPEAIINDEVIDGLYAALIKINGIKTRYVSDIIMLVDRYKQKFIARNILLNNLIVLLDKSRSIDVGFNLSTVINQIKKESENHFSSMDFKSIEIKNHTVKFFNYIENYGGVTLLHEAARMGDIQTVQMLMMYISPLEENNHDNYKTPLDCAMTAAQLPVIKMLLDHMESTNAAKNGNKKYNINYSMMSKTACYCVNMFTCSNTYDPFSKNEPHPFRDSMYSMPVLIDRYRLKFNQLTKQFNSSRFESPTLENLEKDTLLLTQRSVSIHRSLSDASFFTNKQTSNTDVHKSGRANHLVRATRSQTK